MSEYQTALRKALFDLAADMAKREDAETLKDGRGTTMPYGTPYPGAHQGGTGSIDKSATEPSAPSEVRDGTAHLNQELERIAEAITALEERLSIILLPDSPLAGGQNKRNPPTTALGQDLSQLAERAESLGRRITTIRYRVAL